MILSKANGPVHSSELPQDFVVETANELQLPELIMLAKYNLLDSMVNDMDIMQILYKSKNKTTKNDRKLLRNKIIDRINRSNQKTKHSDSELRSLQSIKCAKKPLTLIKEIRF